MYYGLCCKPECRMVGFELYGSQVSNNYRVTADIAVCQMPGRLQYITTLLR